ncbi:hypothetical protein M758_UG164500 [Ceratodon purpureus]|nr:hypothetical protein M758_UG164500 [Ceratodon purpureus]
MATSPSLPCLLAALCTISLVFLPPLHSLSLPWSLHRPYRYLPTLPSSVRLNLIAPAPTPTDVPPHPFAASVLRSRATPIVCTLPLCLADTSSSIVIALVHTGAPPFPSPAALLD